MLIMCRRAGEGFQAGEIEISILEVSRDRVRLGITAPRTCSIIRNETKLVGQQNVLAALNGDMRMLDGLVKNTRTFTEVNTSKNRQQKKEID
jgi:carbon storage regulator CsrA